MICKTCDKEYHYCGSWDSPDYQYYGFCSYSCYIENRDRVTTEILSKYNVSLEDFISILHDLWDRDVNTDYF